MLGQRGKIEKLREIGDSQVERAQYLRMETERLIQESRRARDEWYQVLAERQMISDLILNRFRSFRTPRSVKPSL